MVVVGDGELEDGLLGDGAECAGVAIRHVQADGVRERGGGNFVFINEIGVNEGLLSTRVDEGSDGDWWNVGETNDDRDEERYARKGFHGRGRFREDMA